MFQSNEFPSRTRRSTTALLVLSTALLSPLLANAGTVRVQNNSVIYEAGNNETNTIVIDPRGTVFDQGSGQTLSGFTLTDSTAGLSTGPGCTRFAATALCEVSNPVSVSLDLRDKDDRVSQVDDIDGGTPVAMIVKGGNGNDTLIGSVQADTLDGEAGDDTIQGGNGNDLLIGGFGRDSIVGGLGADTIKGGPAKDTINSQDGVVDSVNCGILFDRDVLTKDGNDNTFGCR